MLNTKPNKQRSAQAGFTLIELLFAMTAFTAMLVVAVSGYLNAMWIYNQTTVSRNNQQQVRTMVDSVGRNIRAARQAVVYNGGKDLCLEGTAQGNAYYKVDSADNHLKLYTVSSCSPSPPALTLLQDLMSQSTAVASLQSVIFTQPILAPATQGAKSVRITFSMRRGAAAPTTSRERQFSNSFELTSTFLLRASGSL